MKGEVQLYRQRFYHIIWNEDNHFRAAIYVNGVHQVN